MSRPSEFTVSQVLEVACVTCDAAPGDPCDPSHFRYFFLGIVVSGLPAIHVRRYQARQKLAAGSAAPEPEEQIGWALSDIQEADGAPMAPGEGSGDDHAAAQEAQAEQLLPAYERPAPAPASLVPAGAVVAALAHGLEIGRPRS
jgi:hypothetical protein